MLDSNRDPVPENASPPERAETAAARVARWVLRALGALVAVGAMVLAISISTWRLSDIGACAGCAALAAGLFWASRSRPTRRVNVALAVSSTLIALLVLEIALSILRPATEGELLANRSLFWNVATFRAAPNGAVLQTPGHKVRELSVYGDSVEYDNVISINNLGLVDHLDSPARPGAAQRYAFVGDSFTSGQGAVPWVPALREVLWSRGHDVDVFNLGVPGTGLPNASLLLELLAPELRFNHIVMLLITDDLYRPQWRPLLTGDQIRFCPVVISERFCHEDDAASRVLPGDLSAPEVVALSKRVAQQDRSFLRFMRTSALVRTMGIAIAASVRTRGTHERTVEHLRAIRAAHPDAKLTVVHLPERDEMMAGNYRFDLAATLAPEGISVLETLHACPWRREHYRALDPHPSPAGYAHIARCVAEHLGYPNVQVDLEPPVHR